MAHETDRPAQPRRNLPLDGVRGFAAYLIVFHHLFFAAGTTSKWADGVGRFTGRLDVGVPIFFVLSGYLLFKPFYRAISDKVPMPSARQFLVRRVLRIFPAYWIALVVLLLVGGVAVRGYAGFFFSFFLLHIYHPHRAISGITQSWSLATEIAFYLMLPFFAHYLRRTTRKFSRSQTALATIGSLSFLYTFSLVFRGVVAVTTPSFQSITPYWLPAQLDVFALGMVIAVIDVWSQSNARVNRFAEQIALKAPYFYGGAIALFVIMSTQFDLKVGLLTSSFIPETLRQCVYGLIGLLMVAPVALRQHGTSIHAFFGWRPLAWVGLVSYGVYLWHQFLLSGNFALSHMPYDLFDGDVTLRFLMVTVSTLSIAALSYYFLEEPLMQRYSRRQTK